MGGGCDEAHGSSHEAQVAFAVERPEPALCEKGKTWEEYSCFVEGCDRMGLFAEIPAGSRFAKPEDSVQLP